MLRLGCGGDTWVWCAREQVAAVVEPWSAGCRPDAAELLTTGASRERRGSRWFVRRRRVTAWGSRRQSIDIPAANAALDTVTRINTPTPEGDWFSTAIPSDGSYGIPEGLIFSFPLRSKGKGDYEIVQGLELNDFSKGKIRATSAELEMERDAVKEMLS